MSITLAMSSGDLDDNARGVVITISGRDKLTQDIAEALISEYDYKRDCNGKLVNMRAVGPGAKALIQGEVTRILNRLRSLQASDSYITDAERITTIGTVAVVAINDTDYQFTATVYTADNSSLTLSDVVSFRKVNLSHTYPGGMFPLQ
jgi:hypothetical protein